MDFTFLCLHFKHRTSVYWLFVGLHLFQSFQNHMKARTHRLMMDKLEESYKIRVELMRH